MLKSRMAAAAALLAVAGAANAEMSVTAALTSDYDWRGVTQSEGSGAFQLSGTYTSESGFYAGVWGSTLGPNFNVPEIDVFAGFAGEAGDLGYDFGINYYTYPNAGTSGNFGELYAGVSYGMFAGKLWWTNDFGGSDDSAFYLEGNATVPIMDSGFSFLAHIGYSDGDGIETYYDELQDSYMDWSVGLGYDVGNFSTAVKYVDGSDNDAVGDFGSRFIFSIQTTLPW